MEEIIIQQVDFKDTKILESLPDKIILHPLYIEYKFKYRARQTNPDTKEEKEELYHASVCVLKSKITAVEAYNDTANQRYKCAAKIGTEEPICPLFLTFKEANEVKSKILNWLLS